MPPRLFVFAAVAAALSAATLAVSAAAPEVYTARFSKLAVGGYDPVAYFKQGQPIRGAAEFSHEYKGATWRFATTENRAAFIADPDAPRNMAAIAPGRRRAATPRRATRRAGRSSTAGSTSTIMTRCSANGKKTFPASSPAPTETGQIY